MIVSSYGTCLMFLLLLLNLKLSTLSFKLVTLTWKNLMLHKILVLLLSSPIINYHFSFKEVKMEMTKVLFLIFKNLI